MTHSLVAADILVHAARQDLERDLNDPTRPAIREWRRRRAEERRAARRHAWDRVVGRLRPRAPASPEPWGPGRPA